LNIKDTPGLLLCYLIRQRGKPVYVGIVFGKSQTVNRRFEDHCQRGGNNGQRIHDAIKREGRENFTVEVIGRSRSRVSALAQLEIRNIKKWRTYWKDGGLNGSRGGCGADTDDPKWRRSHTAAMRKRATDPKWLSEVTTTLCKHWADPEVRRKQAAAKRMLWADPKFRIKTILSRSRSQTPEYRALRIVIVRRDGVKCSTHGLSVASREWSLLLRSRTVADFYRESTDSGYLLAHIRRGNIRLE
jgi:hypothetical protein